MELTDYLLEHDSEICVVIQTWMRNLDSDKIWIDASELSHNVYNSDSSNILQRRGGGIPLIYNKNIISFEKEERNKNPFHYAICRIEFKGYCVS